MRIKLNKLQVFVSKAGLVQVTGHDPNLFPGLCTVWFGDSVILSTRSPDEMYVRPDPGDQLTLQIEFGCRSFNSDSIWDETDYLSYSVLLNHGKIGVLRLGYRDVAWFKTDGENEIVLNELIPKRICIIPIRYSGAIQPVQGLITLLSNKVLKLTDAGVQMPEKIVFPSQVPIEPTELVVLEFDRERHLQRLDV